jgi:hypothetical protein
LIINLVAMSEACDEPLTVVIYMTSDISITDRFIKNTIPRCPILGIDGILKEANLLKINLFLTLNKIRLTCGCFLSAVLFYYF